MEWWDSLLLAVAFAILAEVTQHKIFSIFFSFCALGYIGFAVNELL